MKIYVTNELTKTRHCYRIEGSPIGQDCNYCVGSSDEEGVDRRLVFGQYGFSHKSILFYCFKRTQVILRNNVISNFM